jgi:hypothetical protein
MKKHPDCKPPVFGTAISRLTGDSRIRKMLPSKGLHAIFNLEITIFCLRGVFCVENVLYQG